MYRKHFGLAQHPFSLTPNTHYYLKLPCHQTAFDLLVASLDSNNNFSKITGELGTGKTILCRKILNALGAHKDRYITAFLPRPMMGAESILQLLADKLELKRDENISYYDLLKLIARKLNNSFEEKKTVVIIIDEAQLISEQALEAIRLLTTISSDHGNHLKIVLIGQPELDELLERTIFTELRQKLDFSFQLMPLEREEIDAYVDHRLVRAGYNGSEMFDTAALNLLHKSSQGIPRFINILSHKSLMAAFKQGDQSISEKHVFIAVLDSRSI